MSLALKAAFNRLPGSCNDGGVRFILFCHKLPLLGDEEAAKGDMGGVETVGIGKDEELRDNGLIDVMSCALVE